MFQPTGGHIQSVHILENISVWLQSRVTD